MPNLNKVMLIGNLTRNPELRCTGNGKSICEFGLAINESWGSGEEKREVTTFLSVIAWGKLGEVCDKHLRKGQCVFVEGRVKMVPYEKAGEKRTHFRIDAKVVQFLSPKPDDVRQQHPKDEPQQHLDDTNDDIPF